MLEKLKNVDSQFDLSGEKNIWIVKPSNLCCGSGIFMTHDLRTILRKVESKPRDYYIVQKYIGKLSPLPNYLVVPRNQASFTRYRTAAPGSRHKVRHSSVVSRDLDLPHGHMVVQVRVVDRQNPAFRGWIKTIVWAEIFSYLKVGRAPAIIFSSRPLDFSPLGDE